MGLTAQQRRSASLIEGEARRAGLSPQRAKELVAVAYAESGLNPSIHNRSSNAGGLFQLLSSGYVNRANRMGGVDNPVANIRAILPSYVQYWRSHPNAAPGEAGAAVERSGMGAGFYAGPLGKVGGVAPSVGATGPSVPGMPGMKVGGVDNSRLVSIINNLNQIIGLPPTMAPDALSTPGFKVSGVPGSAQPAPAGRMQGGPTIKQLESFAAPFGLTVTSTTGGHHAPHSYHYQGRAVDFGGPASRMAQLARAAIAHPHQFKEVIYTGPGSPGYSVLAGRVVPNSQLGSALYAQHTNHVHLAR